MLQPLALAAALLLDPAFQVLRIEQREARTQFEVVASEKLADEMERVRRTTEEALVEWKRMKREADSGPVRTVFLVPPPNPLVAQAVAGFATEAEARAYADGEQRKADGGWLVVRITEGSDPPRDQVLPRSLLPALRETLEGNYRGLLQAWEEDRKDAARAGVPFKDPKPEPPQIEILRKGLKTLEDAKAALKEAEGK